MLLEKQIPPVFIPQLNSDDDVQYFDEVTMIQDILVLPLRANPISHKFVDN